MATHTAGTSASSSLTAITFLPGFGSGMLAADVATIAQLIRRQGNSNQLAGGQIPAENFGFNGKLYLPGNRGVISLKPGDVVAADSHTYWPIVISKEALAAASTPWVFT